MNLSATRQSYYFENVSLRHTISCVSTTNTLQSSIIVGVWEKNNSKVRSFQEKKTGRKNNQTEDVERVESWGSIDWKGLMIPTVHMDMRIIGYLYWYWKNKRIWSFFEPESQNFFPQLYIYLSRHGIESKTIRKTIFFNFNFLFKSMDKTTDFISTLERDSSRPQIWL